MFFNMFNLNLGCKIEPLAGVGGETGPITLLSDTFTDADDTLLSDHTPDVRAAGVGIWVDTEDFAKISGNEVVRVGGDYVPVGTIDLGVSQYVLAFDMYVHDGDFDAGMVFKIQDGTHRWKVGLHSNGAVRLFIFDGEKYGPAYSFTDTWTPSVGWHRIEVTVGADYASVSLDGVPKPGASCVSHAEFTGATEIAFEWWNGCAPKYDNVLVTSLP